MLNKLLKICYDNNVMDPALAQVLVAVITVCVPATVTLFSNKSIKRQANKHACRQSILQLIFEDRVRALEGFPPENYQAILDEFDEYQRNGGNSYIHDKVDDYKKWYKKQTSKKVDK